MLLSISLLRLALTVTAGFGSFGDLIGGSVEAITYLDRIARVRLKRSERRIKLCSESVHSKRRLGQVTFRNIEERQLYCETTALAFLARNLDFSAMRRADGFHDGQAQSCPTGVARACLIRPVEALEDMG